MLPACPGIETTQTYQNIDQWKASIQAYNDQSEATNLQVLGHSLNVFCASG